MGLVVFPNVVAELGGWCQAQYRKSKDVTMPLDNSVISSSMISINDRNERSREFQLTFAVPLA
jgi:hypothetical protein